MDGKKDAVGIAYAVGGELSTIEIYSSPGLFRKLWPKLLKGCAIEAMTEKGKESKERPTVAQVKALLEQASTQEGTVEKRSDEISVKVYEGKGVVLFDTEKAGKLLHRQVIKR